MLFLIARKHDIVADACLYFIQHVRLEQSFKGVNKMVRRLIAISGLVLALASSGLAQRGSSPPILPSRTLTPGDTLDVTADDICIAGYTKTVRNVPSSLKAKVYESYGIVSRQPKEYEVDHLISLELGGSNSIRNLWPESYLTSPWNAHVKDRLENFLHKQVCDGKMDLKQAQDEIASDWISTYKKYFGSPSLQSAHLSRTVRKRVGRRYRGATLVTAGGQVWANSKSKKYFMPGSRYYGRTRSGQFMSEHEAIREGYQASKASG